MKSTNTISTESKLKIVTQLEEVNQLIKHCETTGYASFDYETTSLEFYGPDDYPLIVGISFQPGSSWVVPLGHKDSPFKKVWPKVLRMIGKGIYENPNIVKVAWNLKFEYKWSLQYGYKLKGRLLDAMLAKYCLDEERPNGLKEFVVKMFPEYAGYEKALKNDDGKGVNWRTIDLQTLCKYCGIDSDLTLRSMIYMEPRVINGGFYSLFRNMLMMITRVLAEAEFRGILVDRPYLEALAIEYDEKIRVCQSELRNIKSVVKFERKDKRQHVKDLIADMQLEIARIEEDNAPNAALLIKNRNKKIDDWYDGKFSNKDMWKPINFASPPQMAKFLFSAQYGLRLKPYKYTVNKDTKQETENPSTDEESLLYLAKKDKSGFMVKLLENRGLEKLQSTYIKGMIPAMDQYNRVHAGFKINGTVTGRLSCVGPNLQNIPRGSTAADIKKMFIPPPGYLLLEVDYSQAELRIIAELAKDKAMIEIFNRGYNIHVATACKMSIDKDKTKLGGIKDYDKIKALLKVAESIDPKDLDLPKNKEYQFWIKQKKKGKSLNFSIVYQQGDDATAEDLKCTKEEAKKFKKDWFKAFPQVEKWIDKQKARAHRDGYVKNIFGGKRRLHNIDSDRFGLVSEAERQAVNAPVQGGSGYFTLLSMIVIREKILKGELPRDLLGVYTVHDSIGYYIRPQDIHTVVPQIVQICDNPETKKYFGFELKYVKMKVSPEIGVNWADLKDYESKEDYTKWIKYDRV